MSALGRATARLLVYISYLLVEPSHEPALATDHFVHSATMAAVYDPLVPLSHLQAVEDKLRLHAASMQSPPSPPVSANDFINDNDSASTSSPPSSPSTPISGTTAASHTPSRDQADVASPPGPVHRSALLSPTAKKFSALITPPSPAARRITDNQSKEEQRPAPQSMHSGGNGSDYLQSPTSASPLPLHSTVSSSPSPEPLPLPDDLIEDATTAASPSPSPSPIPTSTSAHFTTKSSYPEDSPESRQLKLIYKAFHTICDLFFNVDKDLHNLTDKRQRNSTKQLETGVQSLHSTSSHNHRKSIPATVSPGYGELARRGFDKVLYYLCQEAPDILRMGEDCSFLDIGSGFGKCVLHAKVRGRVRESVGIEYIPVRHEKAAETLHLIRARFVPGVTDVYEQGSENERRVQQLLESVDLSGVQLVQGDITDAKHHALLYRASHIYMFDVVFSDHTMAKILPAIEQANFALFACYHRPAYLERLGCTQFVCIHKMAMKTTGKQSFTCYFYVKAAAGAKVTRHTQRQWVEAAKEGRSGGDAAEEDEAGQEEGSERAGTKKRKRKAKGSMFSVKKSRAHSNKRNRRTQQTDEQQEEDEEEQEPMEDEEEEVEEEEEEEVVEEEQETVRERRLPKKRSARAEMFDAPVVPVVEKKKREVTPATAEVLARDVFNAAVIKAVAARLVIEAEREARLQRRYALGIMQALLAEQEANEATLKPQQASEAKGVTSPSAAQETLIPPPRFQRSSTLITDVHDMNGVNDSMGRPETSYPPVDDLVLASIAMNVSLPPAAYPPSSLSLLPMSPTSKKLSPATVDVDAPSYSVSQLSPSKVSLVSVPSSSLCALSTPSSITPSRGGGTLPALSWPATPVKSAAAVALSPTSPALSSSQAANVVTQSTSSPLSAPSHSSSPPPSPSSSGRYLCPYCSSCVRCVSECFQLPRHQLSKKQMIAHGANHSMPLLLRALPLTVQACIEAWHDDKGTDPRQLLRRMEHSVEREGTEEGEEEAAENSCSENHHSQPRPASEPLSAPTNGAHDVPQPSAARATASKKRSRKPSADKKEVGAWKKPTGKTKNSRYVYAAERKKAATHEAIEQLTVTKQEEHIEQTHQLVAQPSDDMGVVVQKMEEQPVMTEVATVATAMEQIQQQDERPISDTGVVATEIEADAVMTEAATMEEVAAAAEKMDSDIVEQLPVQ